MRKNIRLLAIMFAFTMQSLTLWAATTSIQPVSLYYTSTGRLGNNPKPSKAPAHYSIPFSVILDDDNQQLLATALAEGEFTYYVYNESDEIISQGILNCSNNGSYVINLGFCSYGTYRITVTYNEHTYVGMFEIYQ